MDSLCALLQVSVRTFGRPCLPSVMLVESSAAPAPRVVVNGSNEAGAATGFAGCFEPRDLLGGNASMS